MNSHIYPELQFTKKQDSSSWCESSAKTNTIPYFLFFFVIIFVFGQISSFRAEPHKTTPGNHKFFRAAYGSHVQRRSGAGWHCALSFQHQCFTLRMAIVNGRVCVHGRPHSGGKTPHTPVQDVKTNSPTLIIEWRKEGRARETIARPDLKKAAPTTED